MILDGKTTQFFTNEDEYLMVKAIGIDMSDSYFVVIKTGNRIVERNSYINSEDNGGLKPEEGKDYFPIYTLSEILYKLPEYVGDPYNNSIKYFKDAPFYGFYLYTNNDTADTRTQRDIDLRIECLHEYPIRSAMLMLVECAENPKIGYAKNISDK